MKIAKTILSALAAYSGANAECTGDEVFDSSSLTVKCTPGGISVNADVCSFTAIGVDTADVKLAAEGEGCDATVDDEHVSFDIPASETCGTTATLAEDKTTIVFANKLVAKTGTASGSISRVQEVEIDFSCALALDQQVSLEDAISPTVSQISVDVAQQDSSYDVSMGVFTDNTFTEAVGDDYAPKVPEKIFFALTVASGDMQLEARKCWATPTADSEDTTNYVFLEDGCSTQSADDLEVTQNGSGTTAGFGLSAFTFVGAEQSNVFIHCDVHLCDSNVETCGTVCTAEDATERRRRRRVGLRLPLPHSSSAAWACRARRSNLHRPCSLVQQP